VEGTSPANRPRIAAAIGAAIAVLLAVALIFNLGPWADDELSVAEFVAQGDEICTQAHEEFLDLQTGPPRTAVDAAELVGALIVVAEEEREAIAELEPPASLTEPAARYLEARVRGIDELREGLAAAEAEDAAAYEQTQADLEESQARRFEAAREVGFKECSKPLERSTGD